MSRRAHVRPADAAIRPVRSIACRGLFEMRTRLAGASYEVLMAAEWERIEVTCDIGQKNYGRSLPTTMPPAKPTIAMSRLANACSRIRPAINPIDPNESARMMARIAVL